jgi:gamma-glutamylcyclotransferase (GGCT)/AIG2-like uncharacterized protein YtfP
MRSSLFCYGTLMFAPVRRLHSRRALATESAVLRGYARHALRGSSYPGIVPDANATVAGLLVRGISPALLARLDRWEGAEYERTPVRVETARGERVPAVSYVLALRAAQRILPQDWDAAAFERHELDRWLRLARFRNAQEISR